MFEFAIIKLNNGNWKYFLIMRGVYMLLEMGARFFDLDIQLIADSALMIIAVAFLAGIFVLMRRLLKALIKTMEEK